MSRTQIVLGFPSLPLWRVSEEPKDLWCKNNAREGELDTTTTEPSALGLGRTNRERVGLEEPPLTFSSQSSGACGIVLDWKRLSAEISTSTEMLGIEYRAL